jgi:hypothetical protein
MMASWKEPMELLWDRILSLEEMEFRMSVEKFTLNRKMAKL